MAQGDGSGLLGRFLAGFGGSIGSAVGAFRKAVQDSGTPVKGVEPAKGQLHDPMSVFASSGGYQIRPSQLTYEIMDQTSHVCSPVRGVVSLRTNQVALFAEPARDDFAVGYGFRPRDKSQKMSRALQRQADLMVQWLQKCGDPRRADRALIGDNFDRFTRKVIQDSLVFDQLNFQIRHSLNGKPYEIIAMPASTLRIKRIEPKAFTGLWTGEAHIPDTTADEPKYVQIYQDTAIAEFTPRELAWGVRNPSTNVLSCGYGWSEIEDAIHLISAYLNSFAYNKKFFTQGAAAQGILAFTGGNPATKEVFDEFKREWQSMLTGVQNAHRTPILSMNSGADIKWVDLNKSNRDMQFTEWINFLLRLICGLYQVDPAEINHSFNGGAGETSSPFQNRNENKIKHSKDRGLKPLLKCYADLIDSHVAFPLCPDLAFGFFGLESDDESERIDKLTKKVDKLITVDEARAEIGMGPLPDKKGELILSSIWTGYAQNLDAAAQQDEMGPDGAGFGPEPGDDGDPGPDDGGDAGPGTEPSDDPDDTGAEPDEPDDAQKSIRVSVARLRRTVLAKSRQTQPWNAADEAEFRALHHAVAQRRIAPLDVALRKAVAGAGTGDDRAATEADQLGLVVTRVGATAVWTRSRADAELAVEYLQKGGDPEAVEFLQVVGYPADVVADFRRYAALRAKRDKEVK